jgi:hypothetical protein
MKKNLFGLAALLLTAIVFMGCPADDDSGGDTRKELTAGPAVNALASDTRKAVTFSGASGLTLSAADFAVSTGGTIIGVTVYGNTTTVNVGFAANDSTISAKTYAVFIASDSAIIKGDAAVVITQAKASAAGAGKELTAGPNVEVAASATTANVTFTGASGLSLSPTDFTADNGASVTNVQVVSDTVTITVSFAENTETTPKTYTVSIASDSTKIKGSATVAINQAASAPDERTELTAGSPVSVAASAGTADVTFTGAAELTLSAVDFAVSEGGTISNVAVNSDTATVSVSFAANDSLTSAKTYTVSIAADSTVIKGSATVVITQTIVTGKELTAGPAVSAAATDISKTVTFTGATGLNLSTADFAVSAGGTISNVAVNSNTATVTVSFAANDSFTLAKTYTVSIAPDSTVIKGSAVVVITQAKAPVPGADSLYIGASTTTESAAGTTLASALTWLGTNAASNTAYTIVLGADVSRSATTLNNAAVNNVAQVSITLRGKDTERTIQLTGTGSLFTIAAITLILDQNITLKGVNNNNTGLVSVNTGGILEMRDGAKITGNTTSNGGGVYNFGTFTMEGGTISGNTASYSGGGGGGVYNYGTFTMEGGTISGNAASGTYGYGGGVYNYDGTFTMTGGTISSNSGGGVYSRSRFTMKDGAISGNNGGGVINDNSNSIFTMEGGVISGNTAYAFIPGRGGVSNYGTFTMYNGTISGNTVNGYDGYAGGGAGVYNSGTFTMYNGEISGNTASGTGYGGAYGGGGVYNYNSSGSSKFTIKGGVISDNTIIKGPGGGVFNYNSNSTFIMEGGEISGNIADYEGGGVFNYGKSIFSKTGGIIYGDTNTTHTAGSTENTATNGKGHAVYVSTSRYRNSTAGTDVNLDSSTAANWE